MPPRKNSRKSKQTQIPYLSQESQNIIAGIILLAVAILAIFSTQSSGTEMPIIGQYLQEALVFLFGANFRIIFAPILAILGFLLLIKKTDWNPIKLAGILVFYISLTSLFGWYSPTSAFFDIFTPTEKVLGNAVALIFFLVLFFVSLYTVFGISYKKIFQNTFEVTKNSWQNMKNARQFDDEEDEIIPQKIAKKSAKADKINAELEQIQNSRNTKVFIKK